MELKVLVLFKIPVELVYVCVFFKILNYIYMALGLLSYHSFIIVYLLIAHSILQQLFEGGDWR